MRQTADVVIIGAGVIGCSTAYHLARLGVTDIVVLERDQVGSGSSGKSAAMLSLQFFTDELNARMALYSYNRYMRFQEEVGTPTGFRKTGWLSLATAETADSVRRSAALLQSLSIHTELLSPEEIRYRYPSLRTDDLVLGAWGPDDGVVDPHMIMWGYLTWARGKGVELQQGVRATGIRVRAGRVEGVETSAGFIAAPVVVNAAGPWAVEVARWVGVEIPLLNLARNIVVTGPFPFIPADWPFVDDLTAEWYMRREGPGVLMGMGKIPTDTLEPAFRMEFLEPILDAAIHRMPVLQKATFQTGWTGIRPLTPDDLPILGPVPQVDGFILNCGWGGQGIIQAPIAGQLAAELIVYGQAMTMSLEPFRIERFPDAVHP